MSNLKVAIMVPPEDPANAADRADTFIQAAEISECLSILGNESLTIIFGDDRTATERALAEVHPDVVFNLVEDVPEGADHLHVATALLDQLHMPYTGAPTTALKALGDKQEMKRLLAANGLPLAPGLEFDPRIAPGAKAPSPGGLKSSDLSPKGKVKGSKAEPYLTSPFGGEVDAQRRVRGPSAMDTTNDGTLRYIVKSATEHASIGIDATSVVVGRAAARALIAQRQAGHGGTWFAEQYIDGREFNLGLLETRAGVIPLPVAEILFLDHTSRPKIVGYAEKWTEDSAAYATTPRSFATTPADAPLHTELTRLSFAAWRLFGLKGYARVDFRVDDRGAPYILEVNANPCLAADAGFCAAAAETGLSQTDIVAYLIETALA